MPLYTEDSIAPAYGPADLQFSTGDVLAAQREETFLDLPLLSAVPRNAELSAARRFGGLTTPQYDRAGALGWLAGKGLTETDLPLEDRQYNERELSILADRKVAEIRRQQVLQGGEGGFAEGAARLGTSLALSLLDPLNVASGFVPVIGEARYARIVGAAGGALGRAGARAAVGAAEGVAGAAALEPLIAGARRQEMADYTLNDSLVNIAFGGVFGGGLHSVGGAIGDRLGVSGYAQQAARLSRIESAVRVLERQPDVAATIPAADVAASAVRSPDIPDVYFEDAVTLRRALIAARDFNVNDPDSVAKVAGVRPKPLSQFIKESGGIFDKGGELEARDITNKALPGLVRRQPGRENEATLDAVKLRVFEAGYFPQKSDYNQISDSELLDALADDISGSRVYPASAEDAINRIRADQDYVEAMATQGITRDMDAGAIAARLRDLDDEARQLSAEQAGVTPEQLAEYDASAAKVVAEGTEAQRGQALKAGIAQAVNDQPFTIDPVFRQDRATIQQAAQRLADPAQRPGVDAAAARAVDEQIAEAPTVEDTELAEEVAGLLRDGDDVAADLEMAGITEPDAALRYIESVRAMADDAERMSKISRMAVVCALRS
jgi:hypothetical protein